MERSKKLKIETEILEENVREMNYKQISVKLLELFINSV